MANKVIQSGTLLPHTDIDPGDEIEFDQAVVQKFQRVQTDAKPCYFDCLPPEVIEKILFQLNIEDCCSCRLVCSHWYHILERKICFHFKLTSDNLETFHDANLPSLDKLSVDMEQMFTKHVVIRERTKELMDKVSTLRLNTLVKKVDLMAAPRRLAATYSNQYSKFICDELRNFILTCTNLSVLILDFRNISSSFMDNLSIHQNIHLGSLHTLELYLTFNTVSIEMVGSLVMLKTPKLRNLKIEEEKDQNQMLWLSNDMMCLFLLGYILRNSKLKKLELVNTLLMGEGTGIQMAGDFFTELHKVQLDHLKISYDRRYSTQGYNVTENRIQENLWNWTFINRLLHSQKSLESLDIMTNSPKLIEQVYKILENNCGPEGLQTIHLHLFGNSGISFDFSKLKPLCALKKLHFSVDSDSHNTKLLNAYLLPCSLERLYWNASFDEFLEFAEQQVPPGMPKNKFPNLQSIVQLQPTKHLPAKEYVFLPTKNAPGPIFQMIPQLTSVTKWQAGVDTTYDNARHYKISNFEDAFENFQQDVVFVVRSKSY